MRGKYQFDEQIIEYYKMNKYTKTQIAKKCGCSLDTVRRALQRAGLQEIHFSKENAAIYQDVINDFQQGMYCKDISKKYGIHETTIYTMLNKAGIQRQTGYHTKCDITYFEQIDTPHKAYLLGFITADGAVVNDVLSIEVHEKDVDVLKFAKKEINPEATLTHSRNCMRVTFGAKKIGQDLAKYGVIQNKSKLIKKVPIELIPKQFLPFYFRGLIDGDGCIQSDGKVSIYSGSEDFIKHVQEILVQEAGVKQLGIYKGTTYFITWASKEDEKKLFHYLYDNLDSTYYYPRKYERLKRIIQDNTEVTN